MADQYQGFSNPTIIPDQKYGWQSANQGMSDLVKNASGYLMQQQKMKQDNQQSLAQSLLAAKVQHLMYPQFSNPQASQALDQMISSNPYAKNLLGDISQSLGQSGTQPGTQPQQTQQQPLIGNTNPMSTGVDNQSQSVSLPQTAQNGVSMSPLNYITNTPVVTSQGQTLKTPFGDITQTTQNPAGEASVAGAKSQAEANVAIPTQYAKDIVSSKAKEDTAFNSLNAMTDNLVSSLKGVLIQQGGGGIVPEMIGTVASKLGLDNTGLIKGISAVKRDTAIAYARTLAGGSQGVQKLIEKVADTLPDGGFTSEQAGSTIAEMKFTAMALKIAADNLKLTPQQINNLSEEQLQMLVDSGKTQLGGKKAQDAIYQQIGQQFSENEPRKSINLEGNVQDAKANPIADFLNMKYRINGSMNPVMNARSGNQSNQTSQRITVVSPDGKKGTIPASQLQDALKEGYKQQ